MPQEYTRDQYWDLFEKLPDELQAVILAEETSNDMHAICKRNDVSLSFVSEVSRRAGRVLMGVLAPEELPNALEKEVGLSKAKAKKVAQEIYRHIFFPVRGILAELYQKDLGPAPAAGVGKGPAKRERVESAPAKPKLSKPDSYREPIE